MRRAVLTLTLLSLVAVSARGAVSIAANKSAVLDARGATVTYTISFTNTGDTTLTDRPDAHELTDLLPTTLVAPFASASSGVVTVNGAANAVHWNGSIAPGQTIVVTIEAGVRSGTPAGTVISNQATIQWDGGSASTNVASVTVPSRVVHGAIAKTQLTPNPVVAGSGPGNLVYRVTATARASNARATTMQIRETLPSAPDVTLVSVVPSSGTWFPALNLWETDFLLPGQSATLDVTMTVGSGAPTGTNVFGNTAELIGGSWDFHIEPPATVTVQTSVQAAPAPPALRVVIAATPLDGAFTPGSRVAFDIDVVNEGGTTQPDAPGDELVDLLPPQLRVTAASVVSGGGVAVMNAAENSVRWNGTIAAGGSVRLRIEAVIAADATGTVVNEVTVATAATPFPIAIVVAPAQHAAVPATDVWALLLLGCAMVVVALRAAR